MARRTFLVVFGFVVVLACSSLVFAQDYWQLNKFTADNEKFKYEVTSYTKQWDYDVDDYVVQETRQIQLLELRKIDDETTEVTVGNTYNLPTDQLGDQLSFMGMGMGLSMLMSGGDWFGELMLLGMFAVDLELEVGSSMQMFDGSRIRIVEKQTVAGVEGYFCTKSVREEDEAGNRVDRLTSEWVLAPDVGWPLLIRVYDDGDVTYVMELIEYSRN
ncbi:MAG: hypothetical protein QM451_02330 [Bacillota bacterium]|jgi:hypothetical protein|nr:hypothetical protein [Bacillota bacterium]HHT91740.1 hypothetical protein [Bacillota bacterium]